MSWFSSGEERCCYCCGVLGFLQIEIERKSQKNFQTHFVKRKSEHKGGTTEERKVLQTGMELAPMAASISWGQSRLVQRVGFFKTAGFLKMGCFESGRLSLQVTLPGNHVHLHFGARWRTAHYCHLRKVV